MMKLNSPSIATQLSTISKLAWSYGTFNIFMKISIYKEQFLEVQVLEVFPSNLEILSIMLYRIYG